MKEKRKIFLFVLFILTGLWLICFNVELLIYDQMIEAEKERLGDLFKFADYKPVWAQTSTKLLLLLGLLIMCAWNFFIFKSVREHRKKSNGHCKTAILLFSALLLMPLIMSMNFVTVVEPLELPPYDSSVCWFNAVDILFVCDEELAEHEEIVDIVWLFPRIYEWKPSTWKIENILFPMLQERFLMDSGISINFHGWLFFDSDDSEEYVDFLLIEAMEETGWIPQSIYREANHTIFDSYGKAITFSANRRMDILFVLTYQSTDGIGFAMTEWAAGVYSEILGKTVYWDACILQYREGDQRLSLQLMQHELSHLFGLAHCSNQCVMNKELVHYVYVSWCSSCGNYMRHWRQQHPDQYPEG